MATDDIPDICDGWFRDNYLAMDGRFVAAMAAAIRAGQERPPRVGIDTTPGTRAPVLIRPVVLPVNGHAMGDLADLGDGGMTGFTRRPAPISLPRRAAV